MGDSSDELTLEAEKIPKESTGLEVSDIVKLFTGVI